MESCGLHRRASLLTRLLLATVRRAILAASILGVGAGATACVDQSDRSPVRDNRDAGMASRESAAKIAVVDVQAGIGEPVREGERVIVAYIARLVNGPVIDDTRARGKPVEFVVGRGTVIAGLERGVLGMRPGGRRRIVVPPALAYGKRGVGDVIPPNAELTYEAELLDVRSRQQPTADDAGVRRTMRDAR